MTQVLAVISVRRETRADLLCRLTSYDPSLHTDREPSPDGSDRLIIGSRHPRTGGLNPAPRGPANATSSATPSSAASYRLEGAGFEVWSDPLGLIHVYLASAPGWSAASTSPVLLARLLGSGPDADALRRYALTGQFWGADSPFDRVRKLPAGHVAALRGGVLTISASRASECGEPARDPVAMLRSVITSLLEEHPDAAVELSAGLDSRLVLAAIPRELRRGRTALTLGSRNGPDLELATHIADRYGMDHRVVDLDGLRHVDPGTALELVDRSSDLRGHAANPLASAVLDWTDGHAHDGPRFTGQNGEFARGFYYGGQPALARTSMTMVRGLVRWRICTNDAIDDSLWSAGARREAVSSVDAAVASCVLGLGLPWLPATDELYLRERIHRWVGAAFSGAAARRRILAPFLSSHYLAWARALPPRSKRGSVALCRALVDLDPALARLPLNGGGSATSRATPVTGKLGARVAATGKLAAKVAQRRRDERRPPRGADVLAAHVHVRWRGQPSRLEPVAALPFVDSAAVERLIETETTPAAATVAFLLLAEKVTAPVRPDVSAQRGAGAPRYDRSRSQDPV